MSVKEHGALRNLVLERVLFKNSYIGYGTWFNVSILERSSFTTVSVNPVHDVLKTVLVPLRDVLVYISL